MGLLAEAVKRGPQVKKGPPCTVSVWLNTLDPETRAEAQQILDDESWAHTAISKTFKPLGLDVNPQTIGRHRRGECKFCGTPS